MARGPRHRVPFRRRRMARTDYRARLRLLRSGKPRAIVRKSLNQIQVQIAAYGEGGDTILASAVSSELRALGWSSNMGNLPAAYLTGLLAGRRAALKGVTEAILDLGRQMPAKRGRLFAAARGVHDGGVRIPHDDSVFPDDDRVGGKHLAEAIQKQFQDVRGKVEAS